MALTASSNSLGSLPQLGDKITEGQHLTSVLECFVCGAPARICGPELIQQTVTALLGVPASVVDGGLCTHCSNLAAQACHLHSQLQELDDQLRHLHIRALYLQLEHRGEANNVEF